MFVIAESHSQTVAFRYHRRYSLADSVRVFICRTYIYRTVVFPAVFRQHPCHFLRTFSEIVNKAYHRNLVKLKVLFKHIRDPHIVRPVQTKLRYNRPFDFRYKVGQLCRHDNIGKIERIYIQQVTHRGHTKYYLRHIACRRYHNKAVCGHFDIAYPELVQCVRISLYCLRLHIAYKR